MTLALSIIFGLLTLHGLFFSILVVWRSGRDAVANRYLAGLLLVITAILAWSFFGTSGLTRRWPHLTGLSFPLWFLIGPMILLYVRRLVGKRFSIWEPLLAVPALVALVESLPFYLATSQEKLAYGGPWSGAGSLEQKVYALIYFSLGLICLVLAEREVRFFETAFLEERSSPDPYRVVWLRYLLASLVIFVVADFLVSFAVLLSGAQTSVTVIETLLLSLLIYLVAYVAISQPEAIFQDTPLEPVKYSRSSADDSEISKWAEQLKRLMAQEKLYLDDDLTLSHTADQIGLTRHQLSQTVNQGLGMTFFDFVNGYRVREAERLLSEERKDLRVLQIAHDAGFGSSASFYRAFKKLTGKTPRQYLEHQE